MNAPQHTTGRVALEQTHIQNEWLRTLTAHSEACVNIMLDITFQGNRAIDQHGSHAHLLETLQVDLNFISKTIHDNAPSL